MSVQVRIPNNVTAALALTLFVACQPHCHCHRPHCCRRGCSATTLIAIALAAIATTLFVAQHLRCDPVLATIAIAVRRRYPHHRCKRFHRRHCQRRHRCLNFHRRLPLLLPLPPPPLPHTTVTAYAVATTTAVSVTVATAF